MKCKIETMKVRETKLDMDLKTKLFKTISNSLNNYFNSSTKTK